MFFRPSADSAEEPWVFGLFLIGLVLVIFGIASTKGPFPSAVADHAQRLLEGTGGAWDVDDYEHLNVREPRLRDMWRRTIEIGGVPEEWVRLDEGKKRELQDAIEAIRELGRQ